MTILVVSQEQIQAIRQLDLVEEDKQWETRRAQLARQRLVVLLGDLFKTFPALDQVWLGLSDSQYNNPWGWTIRACETGEQVERLSRIPWDRFKENCTPEELTIRSVFGLVRAWGETMGEPRLSSKALSQLFPDSWVVAREEFTNAWPSLLSGDRFLDEALREEIRIQKRGQALDDQLPTPASPRPGPRF